jgi:RimJ/RimL family protein N-acetyltransferase
MHSLATDRLVLEPQVAAHADAMFAVLSDPAIYEFENAPPDSLAWLRDRYARLESRRSPDGREQWLNWVLRLRDGTAIGYVQATVREREAGIAYEMASAHWGRGLAREGVTAMLRELAARHGAQRFTAVAKRANHRSRALLVRLRFAEATPERHAALAVPADEVRYERAAADDAEAFP